MKFHAFLLHSAWVVNHHSVLRIHVVYAICSLAISVFSVFIQVTLTSLTMASKAKVVML
jgi:hypothetical protein